MSRVWSRCQTEEPWKLGGLQVRPTEEGTRVSEEEAGHFREGDGQKVWTWDVCGGFEGQ